MLFVTKGKTKIFVEIELLLPEEQSLHMKILRANFASCVGIHFFNQHFEILNNLDRIIWTHYQMLVKALTTLPVTRRKKLRKLRYLLI